MTEERVPVGLADATVRRLFSDPQFSVAKRGYDADEVTGFLDTLGARMVALLNRLGQAEEAAKSAQAQIDDYRIRAEQAESSRDLFERTLMLAEETANASVADARSRAERIELEAQADARRMVDETRLRVERMMDAARVDVQKAYADERLALAQAQESIASESDQLETLRLAVAAETMALEEVRNELRRRIRRAATDLLGVAESPDCLGQPVTRGIPEVVARQTEARLEQETSLPRQQAALPRRETAPSAAPTDAAPPTDQAEHASPVPTPAVTESGASATVVIDQSRPEAIDLSEEPTDDAQSTEAPTVASDAFDRFMSQEIEDEPSRSWILA